MPDLAQPRARGNVLGTADALRTAQGPIQVVIENLTNSHAVVTVHAGSASGTANVLHLTGPSLAAISGVRIQDAAVLADGHFTPAPRLTSAATRPAAS